MDVAMIQWPSEEALRIELSGLGQPRLLLVEADADPPSCVDVIEDWVRLPVSPADCDARIRTLESRIEDDGADVPRLSGHGALEFRGKNIHLSRIQVDLVRPMIERFGAVVGRELLSAAAWPDGHDLRDNNLDVTMGRLRRRLEPTGLRVRTVRSRGYLLTVENSG